MENVLNTERDSRTPYLIQDGECHPNTCLMYIKYTFFKMIETGAFSEYF